MDLETLKSKVSKFISEHTIQCGGVLPTLTRICKKNCITVSEFFQMFPDEKIEIA